MRAICIAVGSELLDSHRVDTNSLFISDQLKKKGILTDMKMVAGDNMENLSWAIKNACKRTQIVVITGGLGPTEDDITREAVSRALKRDLVFKEEIADHIRALFRERRRKMPEINTRQAFIIEGFDPIPNPLGTAPGLIFQDDRLTIVLLPGPPSEMKPMFKNILEKKIAPLSNFFLHQRNFRLGGISESETDSLIGDIYSKHKNPATTILGSPGLIEIQITGRSKKSHEEARQLTLELSEKIKEKISDFIISEDNTPVEEKILSLLKESQQTISVAESCTGGALGDKLTDMPGSSDVFLGGVIAYSNHIKIKLLHVRENALKRAGAVSDSIAREMARGVRQLTGSDIGISITGIAGPGGGTAAKPVGTVHFCINSETREITDRKLLIGNRTTIKKRAVAHALFLLHQYLAPKAVSSQ